MEDRGIEHRYVSEEKENISRISNAANRYRKRRLHGKQ